MLINPISQWLHSVSVLVSDLGWEAQSCNEQYLNNLQVFLKGPQWTKGTCESII